MKKQVLIYVISPAHMALNSPRYLLTMCRYVLLIPVKMYEPQVMIGQQDENAHAKR